MRGAGLLVIITASLVSCLPAHAAQSAKSSLSYSIAASEGQYVIRDSVAGDVVETSGTFLEAWDFLIDRLSSSGGKILVHAGAYEVTGTLLLTNRLLVEGEGKATRLLVSDQFTEGAAVFKGDTLNDVTIRGLSIHQTNQLEGITGIEYLHCGTSRILDVSMIGLSGYGACLRDNSFLCEIDGCTFGKIGKSAVYLKNLNKGRAGDWVPNLVSNCTVYTSGMGVELDSAIVANVVDCQVFQTRSYAYYVHNKSNSVLISGCRSYQIRDAAVRVVNSHELNVSSNVFCWSEKEGIILEGVAWATVTANEFIDNGSYNPMNEENMDFELDGKKRPFRVTQTAKEIREAGTFSGVKLINNCRGVVVSSNAIFNWPAAHPMKYGIEEDSSCRHNLFAANNINFCEAGAVLSEGTDSIVADNLSHLETPHAGTMKTLIPGKREIQGFDLRLMDHYLRQQLR